MDGFELQAQVEQKTIEGKRLVTRGKMLIAQGKLLLAEADLDELTLREHGTPKGRFSEALGDPLPLHNVVVTVSADAL